MSIPAHRLDLIAVEEYLAMDAGADDARLEFAAGHIFALAGVSRRHAVITANLTALLHAATAGSDCQVYASELRLRVSEDLYFYPDVMVACGERSGADRDESEPLLLAEVLSEPTAHRDLGLKLAAYRLLDSLRAYLVVYQHERKVEAHWREGSTAPWRHEVFRGDAALPLVALEGTQLPVASIYARTDL